MFVNHHIPLGVVLSDPAENENPVKGTVVSEPEGEVHPLSSIKRWRLHNVPPEEKGQGPFSRSFANGVLDFTDLVRKPTAQAALDFLPGLNSQVRGNIHSVIQVHEQHALNSPSVCSVPLRVSSRFPNLFLFCENTRYALSPAITSRKCRVANNADEDEMDQLQDNHLLACFFVSHDFLSSLIAAGGSVLPDALEGSDFDSPTWKREHRKTSHWLLGVRFYCVCAVGCNCSEDPIVSTCVSEASVFVFS